MRRGHLCRPEASKVTENKRRKCMAREPDPSLPPTGGGAGFAGWQEGAPAGGGQALWKQRLERGAGHAARWRACSSRLRGSSR